MAETDLPPAPGTPSAQELKGALKAFKKRLKVMRMDQSSGKTNRALSSGRESGIVAITPPHQFPQTIWEELVKQGKLADEGHGTYRLVGE